MRQLDTSRSVVARVGADRSDGDRELGPGEPPHRLEPLAVERPLAPLPGLMKSATEYGRPHSAAQTALSSDVPSSHTSAVPGAPGAA